MEKNATIDPGLVARNGSVELDASYAQCRRVVLRAKSSFSFPMLLLPREKRRSMYALYAFLRHSDDLVDTPATVDERRRALYSWREDLEFALAGNPRHATLPALVDTVKRHAIPHNYLFEVLEGVAMDLDMQGMTDFAALERYCYRVASAVGLACMYIWGFSGDDAIAGAKDCGIAFQLTNILRDLKEDADRGRVYLPQDELDSFGYTVTDLQQGTVNHAFLSLMEFQIERAESYYSRAHVLSTQIAADSRSMLRAMTRTYQGILQQIRHRPADVLRKPVRLSRWRQAGIVLTSIIPRLR
ncbi:MAG: squalene/phytoene synthase family protein [Pirellulaceae bacterium]|nr:squalene/phytoene synthase family protein [Pirellulaceae bacterium]